MYNIKVDYMRNYFNFFGNFFYLPVSRTPVSQLNSWQVKIFQKNFWKIFNNTSNLANLWNFKKVLNHCDLVVKGLEFNQSQWLKPYIEFNTKKIIEAEKNNDKDGKLRNRIDVRLVNNEKDYLKWTSKSSYMSYKIVDSNLVPIRKSKVASKLNKLHMLECVFWKWVKY